MITRENFKVFKVFGRTGGTAGKKRPAAGQKRRPQNGEKSGAHLIAGLLPGPFCAGAPGPGGGGGIPVSGFTAGKYLYVMIVSEDGDHTLFYVITVNQLEIEAGEPEAEVSSGAEKLPQGAKFNNTALDKAGQDAMNDKILTLIAADPELTEQLANAETELTNAGISVDPDDTVNCFFVPYLDIGVKDYVEAPTGGTNKTMKLDITPRYKVVITTAESAEEAETSGDGRNAIEIKPDPDKSKVTGLEETNVTVDIPATFAGINEKIYVQHDGDDHWQQCTVTAKEGKGTVTFKAPGFSDFNFQTDVPGVAAIDTMYYNTLPGALGKVENAQKITLVSSETTSSILTNLDTPANLTKGNTFSIDKGVSQVTVAQLSEIDFNSRTSDGKTYDVAFVSATSTAAAFKVVVDGEPDEEPTGEIPEDNNTGAPGTGDTGKGDVSTGSGAGSVASRPTATGGGSSGSGGYGGSSSSAMGGGKTASGSTGSGSTLVPAPSGGSTSGGVGGFTDVPYGHSFATEIAWAQSNGILGGYADGSFRPSANTTRQALWMVLARLSGTYPSNMAEARSWAVNAGISDGTNGEGNMSRQQFITMLYRYAQTQGYALTGSTDLGSFSDNGVVADYAKEAIAWGVANGVITGTTDGRLNPEGTATRAHFAAFVYRFSNLNLAPAASGAEGDVG